MQKRGSVSAQASLDFVLRRGWIVMAALITVGALIYFEVIDINSFITSKCSLEQGIVCAGYRINENSVVLALKNTRKITINATEIRVQGCAGIGSGIMRNDEEIKFIINGCSNIPDRTFRSQIAVTYKEMTGISRNNKGVIIGAVHKGNHQITTSYPNY